MGYAEIVARPTSISIISVFLIVAGFLGLFGQLFMMFSASQEMRQAMQDMSRLSYEMQVAWGIIGSAVTIVCGFGLRSGASWARTGYLVFMIFGLVVSFATSAFSVALLPNVLFIALVAFFLYRPAANAFFDGSRASAPDGFEG